MVEVKYPTRCYDEPKILPRKDPVIWPNKEGMKTTELEHWNDDCREFYKENGFCVMKNVFSEEEVETFKKEIDSTQKAFDNWKKQDKSLPPYLPQETLITEPTDSNTLRSVFKIHRNNELFKRVCSDKRLHGVAQDIVGDDQVYIHQGRINLQPPFIGSGFSWHSDVESWTSEDGIQDMRMCSFVVMTDENTPVNGALMVIPKSHKDFISCVGKTPEKNWEESLRSQKVGTPDYQILRDYAQKYGIHYCEGKPGDVLVFDCNLLHVSHSNVSPFSRRNIFFVYNSMDNKPVSSLCTRPKYIAAQEDEIEPVEMLEHFNYQQQQA